MHYTALRIALVCLAPLALVFGLLALGMDIAAGIIGYVAGAVTMGALWLMRRPRP